MKIGYRTIAVCISSALLLCLFVQNLDSVQESVPVRIEKHPTEPGVSVLSWKSEEGGRYEIYWSEGPVSEDMVWTKVEDPEIVAEGEWSRWTDDGSKTGGLPEDERYYIVTEITENTPPTAESALIVPDPAYKDSVLTIEVQGWFDPDPGDVEGYLYQWKSGGIDIPGASEAILTGVDFDKGDSISCEVTPTDGKDNGTPLMTQVVAIQNTPPSTPTVEIDLSATSRLDGNPDNNSDLICKVTKASPDDIDGDTVVYKYEWLRNGIPFRTVTKPDLSDTIPSTSTSVGETWICIVTPNDGEVDGESVSDSVEIMNALPSASTLSLTPTSPVTSDDLTGAYSYSDPDGDAEDGDKREMRWYKNGQLVDSLNDEMTVPSAETAKDDTWYFRIRVHDGNEYSNYAQSPPVVVGNTPPIATNTRIEPTDPTSWQDLVATYDFSDVDGDDESGSEIRWFLSGVEQSDYNDQKVVPASDTERNQVWNFTVRPKDGTDYGTLKISPDLTIRNAKPEAHNVGLAADPSPATRLSTLNTSYAYFDQDYVEPADPPPPDAVDPENESGRVVEWYKNGNKVLTKNGAGSTALALGTEYTDTYKGDQWYAKVSVHDGHENGPFAQSPTITLENFLPVAQSPYITPASPLTTDDLTAHYTYFDADKRKVDDTEIDYEDESKREVKWFRDGAHQADYDNQMSVPSSVTSKDEKWHFEIRVHDDSSYGPVATSGDVTVGNSTPEITNPAISPGTPISANDLTADHGWSDDDEDTITGIEYRWYKDGILFTIQVGDPPQTVVYDQQVVTSNYTSRGDKWRFTVRASDGTVYSNWAFSGEVTIVNAKPSASNVHIEPSPAFTSHTLQAKYTWSDQDTGDTEAGTEIRWYRKPDGADDFSEWGMGSSVPSSATAKGDQWYMKVKPRDSYGEFGSEVTSPIINVENEPPTASVNPITPSNPVKGNSLSSGYSYSDADGDAEDGDKTEITWYRDASVYKTGNKNTADILTVPADVILKGEVWKFGVKPHDGTTLGSEATTSVTVGNTPPSADDAKVTPEDPKTGDDLNASYTFNDPDDGDSESGTEIRWFKDASHQPALNNFTTVDSSLTTEGETWHFNVKPNDGTDWGTEVTSASATIGNTAPAASNLSLTPDAQEGETITLTYDWTDADPGDSETGSKIEWFRKLTGEGDFSLFKSRTSDDGDAFTVTAGEKGEKWYCTVEPYDGENHGTKQTSSTVTVANTPPTASGLIISPSDPKAGEKITGDYNYADADGDDENGSVMTWYRKPKGGTFGIFASDTTTAGATGGIKEVTATGREEQWYFTIKPKDGSLFGQEYQSAIVTVVNSPPDKPKIELSPDVPASDQNILSTITEHGDADGDPLNFEYLWENGAGPLSRIKSATTDILSGSLTNEGETWTCRVRASDGLAVSDWSDAKTVRVNIVPSITGATIGADPSPATANSTLTATAVGWSDAFGGSEGYDYQWLNNGNPIGGAPNQNTLTGPWFSRGDKVSCKITPNDGIETGNSETTAQLDIANAPPTADPATITPDPARTTDTLTGHYSYADGDGDAQDGTTLQWTVSGNPISLPPDDPQNVLPSGYTSRGDVVVFQVIPRDGTDFGAPATAQLTIQNTPPEARNVSLAAVMKGETLTANYTYYDADGDAEDATQIRWYKNNELQVAYNDSPTATAGDRGEQWYYTVLPYDGTDYGVMKVSNAVTILNTPPALDSVTIGPDPAYVSSTFTATPGAASDNDGDDITFLFQWQKKPEDGSWDNIGGATSNTLSGAFQKGDGIRCVVTPHDGIESGSSVTSNVVTVSNSAPSASNPLVSPSEPISTNNLTAIYGFSDPDGDEESGSLIKWYVNDVDSGYTGKTLPSSAISEGEQWHFTVRPGDGTDLGSEKTSGKVTIGNSPPTATNPHVEPSSPQSDDTLTAVYTYDDPDGDGEAGTQVQWYRNGSAFTTDTINAGEQSQIAPGDVHAGDRWFFTVRPKDGEDFGTIVSSGEVTVGNTPPVASNVHVEPGAPKTTEALEAKYDYSDADGDTESGTEIRWYKDGDHQPAYDNSKTVPASATSKSQWWHFTVKPKDGIQFGTQLQSGAVHIDNSPPVAAANPITPSVPIKGSSLSSSYGYSDSDGDEEDGDNTVVTWYRNGSVYKTGNKNTTDILTVPEDVVLKDEVWKFTVQVHDGTELGPEGSASVTIRNQAPSASDLAIDPERPIANQALTATYDWSDPDEPLDSETGSRIRWYANGVEQAAYRDLLNIPGGRTLAGEEWSFTIEPSDGDDFGSIQVSPLVTINRPPTQPVIAISPDAPKAKTNLTCTVTTASTDADGDTVKYEYRWSTVGKEIVHGPKDALSDLLKVTGDDADTTLVKGETWTCRVMPTDSLENGTPAYDFVDIVNTPPAITDAVIQPDPAYTNTPLSLSITASDDDNDPISYGYQWRKGGVNIAGATGATLSSSEFEKGDSIDCVITPHDGTEPGAAFTTAPRAISNSAPSAPSVDVTPNSPGSGDDLVCTVSGSVDPDGDAIEYEYQWFQNGNPLTPVVKSATTDTVPSSNTSSGDTWICRVTPIDTEGARGVSGSDSVTIQ